MTSEAHGTEKKKGRGKGDRHDSSINPRGKAGASTACAGDGSVNLGTGGAVRAWTTLSISFTGGIIAQLIEEVEDQLGSVEYQVENAQACIEWYEREKNEYEQRSAKLRKRLEDLGLLRQQLESIEVKSLELTEDDEAEDETED